MIRWWVKWMGYPPRLIVFIWGVAFGTGTLTLFKWWLQSWRGG